jgi:hypothetical protein
MNLFAGLLVWLALLALIVGFVLLIPKSKRKTGQLLICCAVWVFVAAAVIGIWAEDDESKSAGFEDAAQYRNAKQAGITDPKVWQAKLEADREKAAAAAEQAAKEAQAIQAAKEAAAKAEEEKCRSDLSCWGEKHSVKASFACRKEVERLAKYDFEWTDGWTGLKFTRYRWKNLQNSVVSYIGDAIKFQNGFGAFQNHIYVCDFDTNSGLVVDASARPGRL